MNKIQQYKQILEQKPEGATHYGFYDEAETDIFYLREGGSYYGIHKGEWSRLSSVIGDIKSLSDLQTIVDQAETIERLRLVLRSTNRELSRTIRIYNDKVKGTSCRLGSDTCYSNDKLLKELNND